MTAARIYLASLPYLSAKIIKIDGNWQSSDKNKFAQILRHGVASNFA